MYSNKARNSAYTHRVSTASAPLAVLAAALFSAAPTSQAQSIGEVVRAPVVSADPIIEVVEERIPFERCREERVPLRGQDGFFGGSYTPTILGAVVGGTAGSVLGNNSSRRDLITGAGAILGGSIGRDIGKRQQRSGGDFVVETVCTTEYEVRERERVGGYRVRYRYEGQIMETRTASDPGSSIAVRTRVEPLL
jgi:uncharacterized protein YcfJ